MEVVVDEACRLAEIWLTKKESEEGAQERLREIIKKCAERKYRAVVYRSGRGNLEDLTAALVAKTYRKMLAGNLSGNG